MTQTEILIDGMTCDHCEHAIHGALAPLDGVSDVQVSATTGVATINHDDRFDQAGVAAAVAEAGYSVRM